MTRNMPIMRGYRTFIAAAAVVGAGILVGQTAEQPVPVPVVQASPASDQAPAAAAPSDAPVANLIALRSMDASDQSRYLAMMTDPQLVALQTVAVTTPTVLPQANDEAQSRGLPEMVAGGTDSFGAVTAVPVQPSPQVLPAPGYTPAPAPSPQVSDPCHDSCDTIAV